MTQQEEARMRSDVAILGEFAADSAMRNVVLLLAALDEARAEHAPAQQDEKLEQLAMQALAADRKAFTLQDTLDRERVAHAREIKRLRAEPEGAFAAPPGLLVGVLADYDGRCLSTEEYALLAQVNPDDFCEQMAERLADLSPDQFVYLCSLARLGLAASCKATP